jgi:hypothetical protein
MFRRVSKSGQTLGNISEKHRETSNVSEFARKHFCFSGSKFCFRNNVSTGGQTGKHLRKHRESEMFPQQCFLVCPGLNKYIKIQVKISIYKNLLHLRYILFIVMQTLKEIKCDASLICIPNRDESTHSPYYIPATKKWRSVFNECRDRLGCLGNDEPDLKKAWKSVAEDLVRAPAAKTMHQEREIIDDILKGVDLDKAKKIAKDKKKLQEYLTKVS